MTNDHHPRTTEAWLRQAMATTAVKPHPNQHPNVARVANPNASSSNVELALSDLAQLKLLNNVAHIPGDARHDWAQQDRRTLWTQTRNLLKKQGYQVVGAGMQSGDIQAARQIFDRDDFDLWINIPILLNCIKETGQTEGNRFEDPHAFLLFNPYHVQGHILQPFLEFLTPNVQTPRHTVLLMPPFSTTSISLDKAMVPLLEEAEGRLATIKAPRLST